MTLGRRPIGDGQRVQSDLSLPSTPTPRLNRVRCCAMSQASAAYTRHTPKES
jgi:hypothetical protein